MLVNGNMVIDWGPDCIEITVERMVTDCENKIITAFNGARFDFYVLVDEVNRRKFYVHNITISNNRVLDFTWSKIKDSPKIRVFDVCQF